MIIAYPVSLALCCSRVLTHAVVSSMLVEYQIFFFLLGLRTSMFIDSEVKYLITYCIDRIVGIELRYILQIVSFTKSAEIDG